jgi:hypothetical protein
MNGFPENMGILDTLAKTKMPVNLSIYRHFILNLMGGRRVSNPRPLEPQSSALTY